MNSPLSDTPTDPIVHIEDVDVSRGQGRDRFHVSVPKLTLFAQTQMALVGPSGSGKSTLLDLVGLLAAPIVSKKFHFQGDGDEMVDVGALWVNDQKADLAALRASRIGYVVQNGALLPYLTVSQNIELAAELCGLRERGFIFDLAKELGIANLISRLPSQLSIGQRQRVAVARALARKPKLILADEPTAALDHRNAEAVMELLVSQCKKTGAALLCATHDLSLLDRYQFSVISCEVSGESARATIHN